MASGGGTAKIEEILEQLEQNLEAAKLSLKQAEGLLAQLKVLGRDPGIAAPIFSRRGIGILSKYGFDDRDEKALPTSREALRCLANACLLNPTSRQALVDAGYASRATERLKVDNRDDEFLISRLLFLMTYNTTVDFAELDEKHQLTDSINKHVARHAKTFGGKSGRRMSNTSPMIDMALAETIKLMFNLTYYYPDLIPKFTPSVDGLVTTLVHHSVPDPPLQSPINYLINALLNLDLASASKKTPMGRQPTASPLFPHSDPEIVAERLTSLFFKAMNAMPEKELDEAGAPLCTLIRRVYELAYPQMKEWMECILLPKSSDREKPLGQGDTMAAKLLRLSCSPSLPTLRENISGLLFELSDKDANKFVKNVGYGFASGFLMSHNIEVPSSAMEANSTSTGASAHSVAEDVNPITGQKWSAVDTDKGGADDMSEEEKEREAERLFVLFERLRATGVVDVKNPVQQAVDEGRFEELPD